MYMYTYMFINVCIYVHVCTYICVAVCCSVIWMPSLHVFTYISYMYVNIYASVLVFAMVQKYTRVVGPFAACVADHTTGTYCCQ